MLKFKSQRPKHFQFDLLVLGSGAGGEVAAYITARAGKRVAIVEMEKAGGECPNFGCVPTKSLLYAAETYRMARMGARFGVHTAPRLVYPEIKAWKDLAVEHTGTSHAEELYKAEGIHSIKGRAKFVSPWTVAVGNDHYTAENFLIATGSTTFVPPIPGLQESGYITSREAIDITRLPDSIFIIGGGAIGCEFAELFSTFGAKVAVADITPRLIMAEDPEAGEFLRESFQAKGVQVHTGSKVTRVQKDGAHKIVYFEKEGKTHKIRVQTVMVASGKAPNTDIGLESAGVIYNRGGVVADKFMQTSAKHIYAAGDITGPYRFTHTASYQSRIVANNILHPRKKVAADYKAVPRCTFVDPEIASVGMSEHQLQEKHVKYQTAMVPISVIGRANTSDVTDGFVKVIADKKGRLLGGCIASPRAGEMIHELALAVQHRMTARDVGETIHAYPTWSEAVRLACQKIKSV